MFWTEEEAGPLMRGASLCGEKSLSVWVDRFVSNLDRSFMCKQGCAACVHVHASFFFFLLFFKGFMVFGVRCIQQPSA